MQSTKMRWVDPAIVSINQDPLGPAPLKEAARWDRRAGPRSSPGNVNWKWSQPHVYGRPFPLGAPTAKSVPEQQKGGFGRWRNHARIPDAGAKGGKGGPDFPSRGHRKGGNGALPFAAADGKNGPRFQFKGYGKGGAGDRGNGHDRACWRNQDFAKGKGKGTRGGDGTFLVANAQGGKNGRGGQKGQGDRKGPGDGRKGAQRAARPNRERPGERAATTASDLGQPLTAGIRSCPKKPLFTEDEEEILPVLRTFIHFSPPTAEALSKQRSRSSPAAYKASRTLTSSTTSSSGDAESLRSAPWLEIGDSEDEKELFTRPASLYKYNGPALEPLGRGYSRLVHDTGFGRTRFEHLLDDQAGNYDIVANHYVARLHHYCRLSRSECRIEWVGYDHVAGSEPCDKHFVVVFETEAEAVVFQEAFEDAVACNGLLPEFHLGS